MLATFDEDRIKLVVFRCMLWYLVGDLYLVCFFIGHSRKLFALYMMDISFLIIKKPCSIFQYEVYSFFILCNLVIEIQHLILPVFQKHRSGKNHIVTNLSGTCSVTKVNLLCDHRKSIMTQSKCHKIL